MQSVSKIEEIKRDDTCESQLERCEEKAYSNIFIEREQQELLSTFNDVCQTEQHDKNMSSCLELSSVGAFPHISSVDDKEISKVYELYMKNKNNNDSLIISRFKTEVPNKFLIYYQYKLIYL